MGALSLIVGGVALMPAGLALTLRPYVPSYVTVVLGHAAATGFIVALAASSTFCNYTTSLLQKSSSTGHVSWLSQVFFWPYHLGLRAKLYTQRRTSKEPLYNQVTEHLYIGGWPERAAQLPAPVSAVLDVTCELPRTHHHKYLCLPTWDTQAPSAAAIQTGVDWALGHVEAGRPVYIHCAHGHGRSATVLAAVLLAQGKADSAESAVALMRRSRPRVRLNKVQAAALRDWMAAYWEPQQQQKQQVSGAKGAHTRTASQEGQQRASLTGDNVFKRVSC